MSKKIANTALLITLITFISKLFGFTRDVVMAATYGTTIYSDSFIMAQSIIGVITSLVLAALGTTFIPVMSDYILYKSKNETNKFLNVVYTITITLTIFVCLVGYLFIDSIVFVFAPEFSDDAHILTVEITKILLPTIVLTAIVTLSSAKLQNHGHYLIPAAIGFPLNFVLVFTMIYVTDLFGIHGLAVALVVATVGQVLIQLPFTRNLGYRFKVDFDMKEEGLRRIGILIIPIMIGSGIQQINTIVDRIMASGLSEGSIAALNFSNRLSLFIIGLLSAAVVSIFYTSMSNYFSAGKDELFKRLLRNTINVSIIIIVPASVGLIFLRLPIVQMIFERGMFDRNASEMTAVALLYYTIGLIGFLLRDVISRAFYALKDTKTAMINGSIAVALNIVLSLTLVPFMGIGGLALGTSISAIIGTVLLMYSLHKRIGDFGIRNINITFIKVMFSSLTMGIISSKTYTILYGFLSSNSLSVCISILVGIVVYIICTTILKVEEINLLKQKIFILIKKQ
ncbi:murein biosynthesis integral membrane protein MurJ [Paenibacillus sp. GCM10012307]|uniref:Probable lipid II flippase MurJ n=1 Tax=Paenibacillus roseus TaxID=2798579 RepID=A0A934J7C2_9BACL|nr:murein biosynthesis integral membrane protein MurJ [Paenibacillus roseus]MBJ6361618.1 murein biosynthesis integral membrane protein MurJ [Paenibacillus roseus]